MTAAEVMAELERLGTAPTKKTHLRHGAHEPLFGVKVGDMRPIVKRVKIDYQLALDLYATGNSDAKYLAGLIADDMAMTKNDLSTWVRGASWSLLSEYTVPWVASGGRFGMVMAIEWIESKVETTATAGWATLSSLAVTKPDADLDLPIYKKLLARVAKTIHDQPNRVRYTMNGFVIATGSRIVSLTDTAVTAAVKIGTVDVFMGDTACKVPDAAESIAKVSQAGTLGQKRKTAKC